MGRSTAARLILLCATIVAHTQAGCLLSGEDCSQQRLSPSPSSSPVPRPESPSTKLSDPRRSLDADYDDSDDSHNELDDDYDDDYDDLNGGHDSGTDYDDLNGGHHSGTDYDDLNGGHDSGTDYDDLNGGHDSGTDYDDLNGGHNSGTDYDDLNGGHDSGTDYDDLNGGHNSGTDYDDLNGGHNSGTDYDDLNGGHDSGTDYDDLNGGHNSGTDYDDLNGGHDSGTDYDDLNGGSDSGNDYDDVTGSGHLNGGGNDDNSNEDHNENEFDPEDCGFRQPYTVNKTNAWDVRKWCGQLVSAGPFDAAKRDACDEHYLDNGEYTGECEYVNTGGGIWKCKMEWPPRYPCESVSPSSPGSGTGPSPPSATGAGDDFDDTSGTEGDHNGDDHVREYDPDNCGFYQPYTVNKTNAWDVRKWCGQLVSAGPFDAAKRDACDEHYLDNGEYTGECEYVNTGGGIWKCKMEWPPRYPCESISPSPPSSASGSGQESSPSPPSSTSGSAQERSPSPPLSASPSPPLSASPSPPLSASPSPPRNPSAPPPPSSPPTVVESDCGFDQPYTVTKTNAWDTQRWCGQIVTPGPFNAAKRDVCDSYYLDNGQYSSECHYVNTGGGVWKCKMDWPPHYPCEPAPGGGQQVSPSPQPSPPNPAPPPPSASPGTNADANCGLIQPYDAIKTNAWDTQRWCGQLATAGPFDAAKRDVCESYYVENGRYSSECRYVEAGGGVWRCKMDWPPHYPCA